MRRLALGSLLLLSLGAHGEAVPGGVYVWELPAGVSDVTFLERPAFVQNGRAIVGVPITTKPGTATIEYVSQGERRRHGFTVRAKQYTEQHITIEDTTKVDPPAHELARIRREARMQRELYNRVSAAVALGPFVMPLEGVTTSLYGHRRFFNGQPRSPHSGLDIAADTGTPVIAPARATVTLADDLFFNGKTIFLDHGQGLVTMYCHLSEHRVAPDDVVEQGDVIGLVGATGRVTGPHLHWSVSLNGYRVDPSGFMQALQAIVSAPSGAE